VDAHNVNNNSHNDHSSLLSYYTRCSAKDLDLYDDFHRSSIVKRMDRFLAMWIYHQAIRFLPSNPMTILDVGCGSGNFIGHLLRYAPCASITGVDFCEELLELATRRFETCAFRLLDLCNMPPEYPKVQVVFCLGVINHFASPILDDVLLSLSNMSLQRLVISFVHSHSLFSGRVLRSYSKVSIPYMTHSSQKIINILTKLGMHMVKCKHVGLVSFISPVTLLVMDHRP
jgi:2-polyprenyl-3-methyl-5-hydroxy-6-metoxy-1,4-benzoquinol methylase